MQISSSGRDLLREHGERISTVESEDRVMPELMALKTSWSRTMRATAATAASRAKTTSGH